jgi:hypothetical protein
MYQQVSLDSQQHHHHMLIEMWLPELQNDTEGFPTHASV